MMTMDEVRAIMARPHQQGRTVFLCYQDGDEYVTEFDGKQIRATNEFQLDSFLIDAGAPWPRSLYLVEGKPGDHSLENSNG